VLLVARRMGALRRPGLTTGIFAIGYGVARIVCEFFREPDAQLGFLFGGATMGMLLSLPLIAAGVGFLVHALRSRASLAA
jgi:phosphatidylglycerol:prolipoprotein diacylglycerol transferase